MYAVTASSGSFRLALFLNVGLWLLLSCYWRQLTRVGCFKKDGSDIFEVRLLVDAIQSWSYPAVTQVKELVFLMYWNCCPVQWIWVFKSVSFSADLLSVVWSVRFHMAEVRLWAVEGKWFWYSRKTRERSVWDLTSLYLGATTWVTCVRTIMGFSVMVSFWWLSACNFDYLVP